jgi:hypothetical protein
MLAISLGCLLRANEWLWHSGNVIKAVQRSCRQATRPCHAHFQRECAREELPYVSLKSSFDHLVGAAEKRQRNRNAERLGSSGVNDQLKVRRLQDGEVGRL